MRLIIPELPYEQPLAKGLWRYEQDGTPTGAVEHWRLSKAHDGYQFLRVDLDARLAPSGRSYLFHAVLDEQDQPVRLKYRLWQGTHEVLGNIHLETDAVLFTSGQGDNRVEEMISLTADYQFWFPSSSSLGFLARMPFNSPVAAVTLVVRENGLVGPNLLPQVTTLEKFGPDSYTAEDGQEVVYLSWDSQQRKIWLDSAGWPLRMTRQNGVTATETQLVKYKRIIRPGEEKHTDLAIAGRCKETETRA